MPKPKIGDTKTNPLGSQSVAVMKTRDDGTTYVGWSRVKKAKAKGGARKVRKDAGIPRGPSGPRAHSKKRYREIAKAHGQRISADALEVLNGLSNAGALHAEERAILINEMTGRSTVTRPELIATDFGGSYDEFEDVYSDYVQDFGRRKSKSSTASRKPPSEKQLAALARGRAKRAANLGKKN